jgi:hypothetical protein
MAKPSTFLQVAEKSLACAAQPNQAGQNFNAVALLSKHPERRSVNITEDAIVAQRALWANAKSHKPKQGMANIQRLICKPNMPRRFNFVN